MNHLKNIYFVFALLLLAMFSSAHCAEKITFASPEDLPPKIFMSNGQLHGTYVDLIREVCKRMQVEPIFVQYPWARAMAMAKSGKVDAIFPPFKTRGRQEFLYFPSESISHTRNTLFAKKSRHIKIKKMQDLKNVIVGVNDQYSYGAKFDDYKNNLTLDLSKTEEMQINKLAHTGQVRMDVAAASEDAFKFLSQKMGLADQFEVVYVLSETPSYVAFTKKGRKQNKKWAEEFGRALKKLKKEGMIQVISERYSR